MKRMHFADYNEMLIIEIGPLEQKLQGQAISRIL